MVEIQNAHRLEALFGHWPDFRGAQVPAVRLFALRDRPAQLELDIEVAEVFTDGRGVDRDRQRCVATLRFSNVLHARVDALWGFRQEGALAALEIAELGAKDLETVRDDGAGRRYRVRLVPTVPFPEALFFCDEVAVLGAISISRAI
jgi:hypothetical protein